MEDKQILEVHVFAEGLQFPVIVFACSEEEKSQIHVLGHNFQNMPYTTEEICRWCVLHGGIEYHIATRRLDMLRPRRRRDYNRIISSIPKSDT